MATSISRRNWLKAGALGTGALLLEMPSLAQGSTAAWQELWPETTMRKASAENPIRLMSNENPYGPSESARKAIIEQMNRGNRYPYDYAETLKKDIATVEGVSPDHILLGAGSTEILCLAAAAYSIAGKKVVSSDLTFMALINYATKMGAINIQVPVDAQYKHNLTGLENAIDADTRLVYLDNPGNPTGTLLPTAEVKAFVVQASKKAFVFVDEAYRELVMDATLAQAKTRTIKDVAISNKNVLVARTFSKVYGLAGMRIGYAVAHPETILKLSKYQMVSGLTVSSAGIAAAKASLADDAFVESTRKANAAAKDFTMSILKQHNFTAAESHTNFILFNLKGRDPEQYRTMMEQKNILLRASMMPYQGQKISHCRLSIGTMEEMKIWAQAFNQYLQS